MSDAFEEFGPYLVYERLGQGGMATVHRAEKRGVGIRRPVALKRLLPHVAADPALVKLFVDEARLASHLHHANVAQTYELGRVGDTFFIAMEYASGPTLAQIVRQCQRAAGEIPLTITVSILTQICEALDHAHNLCDESGQPLRIIHRDVSPSNIIVTSAGIVKLIDFGIAKATISSVKTQTGFIKGKFGYIAPEYISGRIDARVDLFAIGVVAHEMLAGRRLFEGKDDFETLQNIREMNLSPPSRWNPHVTADLDDIVMTALNRDPADRWQSAQAMQVALAHVAREFGMVVGSHELAEWVDWAFRQVSPETGVTGVGPDDTAAFRGGPRPDSSLSIQVSRVSTDAIDVTPPPELTRPTPEQPTLERMRFPSDSDETVQRERVAPPREVDLQTPMPELAPPPPPPPMPTMPPPPPPLPR
ncbi:MAG TPA: serine/threonine-protein kinase, partial [Kofleriaceae bacterium]